MNIWFECTSKYIKMDENGHEKKVTETYLLDAVSFTEAESRIYKELQTMVSGEFNVTKIAKTNISEIIPSENGDRWYKAKVSFITIDEESGKEKRIAQYMLAFANNTDEAGHSIKEAMNSMMCDFEITSVSESNILDVFPYSEEKKTIPANLKPIDAFIAGETPVKAIRISDSCDIEVYRHGDTGWMEVCDGTLYEDNEIVFSREEEEHGRSIIPGSFDN